MASNQVIVLASASPRRAQLVKILGRPFRISPSQVDESLFASNDPLLTPLSVCRGKSIAALPAVGADEVLLTADTVVVHRGRALGKPSSASHASTMLSELAGESHVVATGVWLSCAGREWAALTTTAVRMRPYSVREIRAYLERGEPFDKAGGYAIQDTEFHPVDAINGCYPNVVGLPLCAVLRGLEALGVALPSPEAALIPTCHLCEASRALVER